MSRGLAFLASLLVFWNVAAAAAELTIARIPNI